jgi:YesN/AraC family two-component response regulator
MGRILVVDDETDVVRLLKKFLISKTYDVYTAINGLEAIQKIKEVNPHLVLLDIIMPGMGGLDALREIKKINPKIAVIIVTAVVDAELAKRAMQLGADDYIYKPINFDDVENRVLVKMVQLLD